MEPFSLSTERLRLEPLTAEDAPAIFGYCQDPEFERYLTIPWPYSVGDAEFFVGTFAPEGWQTGNEPVWGVRRGGELLGVVSLRAKHGRYDVGYWLGSRHRGHGFMPEAVRTVIDWGFTSGFAGEELGWECVAGNFASLAVARKVGFTFTGVGPSVIPARDGTNPDSWHGVLKKDDDRTVKPGWPSPTPDAAEKSPAP